MSQATEILDYIDKHGSITDNEARDVIGTEMVKGVRRNGQPCRYARYWRG